MLGCTSSVHPFGPFWVPFFLHGGLYVQYSKLGSNLIFFSYFAFPILPILPPHYRYLSLYRKTDLREHYMCSTPHAARSLQKIHARFKKPSLLPCIEIASSPLLSHGGMAGAVNPNSCQGAWPGGGAGASSATDGSMLVPRQLVRRGS